MVTAGKRVGGDCGEDDAAADDVLIVGIKLDQIEAIADAFEEEDAENGAPHRTTSAEDAGAADDHRGDGGEDHLGQAIAGDRRAGPRHQHDAG